ncbi:MAG: hypothetical protein RMK20_16190, partial [Verrucomicrobiales bacterium]|nr:hypothetical protein [Verrucomicrobiales bacterium]
MITCTRRQFLQWTSTAVALAGAAPALLHAQAAGSARFKRGIMWGTVGLKGSVLEKMKAIREAGFDGVEMSSHMDQEEVLRARDATGLEITSVCGAHHWKLTLSDPDPKVREEGLEALKQTLR